MKLPPRSYAGRNPQATVDVRRPITRVAVALLGEHCRHEAFVLLVEVDRATIEFAGREILGLAVRRSQAIFKELGESGGPLLHFQRKVLERMSCGEVGRGKETEPSPTADLFFAKLSPKSLRYSTQRLSESLSSHGDPADPEHEAGREFLDYKVCKHLAGSRTKKGATRG